MDIIQMMKGKVTQNVAENGNSHPGESKSSLNQPKSEITSESGAPQWKIHGSHMVSCLPSPVSFKTYYSGQISPENKKICVAAFDMDDTLICTKSGIKFGRGPHDWKWRNDEILPVLKEKVQKKNMVLVIFTNQAAVSVTEQHALNSKSYKNLTVKIGLMMASLKSYFGDLPVLFFASTGKPRKGLFPRSSDETHLRHRKPERGMWDELERYLRRGLGVDISIDLNGSYYIGDAAGRDGDHSDVDKGFAGNVGVPFFVPEEYFGV